ncbi:hypothetical protein GCM10028821_39710 [Hymenobacter jeollabukensis]
MPDAVGIGAAELGQPGFQRIEAGIAGHGLSLAGQRQTHQSNPEEQAKHGMKRKEREKESIVAAPRTGRRPGSSGTENTPAGNLPGCLTELLVVLR